MVYDASLGYDPEEWEECPEPEHFLVFSFFTRFLLSALAVSFAYFFFKLVEENKNKGNKKEEEENPPVTGELLQEVGQKLEKIFMQQQGTENQSEPQYRQQQQKLQDNLQEKPYERNEQQTLSPSHARAYEAPSSVDELLKEAQQYLQESVPPKEPSPRPFGNMPDLDNVVNIDKPSSVLEDVQKSAQQMQGNIQEAISNRTQQVDEAFKSLFPDTTKDPINNQVRQLPSVSPLDLEMMSLEQQQLIQHPQQLSPQPKSLSKEEKKELYEWEMERERLENERISKLKQDRLVGGDESEFENSEQAIDRLLPASHISFLSASPDEDSLRNMQQELPGQLHQQSHLPQHLQQHQQPLHQQEQQQQQQHQQLHQTPQDNIPPALEKKLQQEINLLAGKSNVAQPNRDSYRDSELTDYDISDFNVHDAHFDNASAPSGDLQFVQPGSIQNVPRHETGDSDEFVKVQMEPIYDVPPPADKVMTVEEARQLQELCHEYDFGIDLGTPNVANVAEQVAPIAKPRTSIEQQQMSQSKEVVPPPFGVIGDRPAQARATSAVIPSSSNDAQATVHIQLPAPNQEDTKNIVAAEMFVQDALEYIGNQEQNASVGGFVMEEDMLSSPAISKRLAPNQSMKPTSGDPTSQMVKTMEVFERIEHDEHDDMTYAPEIQSVEIPPDQMSENSDNLQEYFDRVSAEAIPPEIMKPIQFAQNVMQQTGTPQAPQILSAYTNRALSNSSLASGRSGRSQSGFSSDGYPRLRKQSSLLSVLGVTSMQEMLLTITSLDSLSDAMRKAGLESTNIIFGIDYTASNKYQGEESFGGRSLHTIHPNIKNPYQQVITILGNTLAPFASTGRIPLYGFGDAKTGDWSTFPLNSNGDCTTLDEVLKVYNEITPNVELSGPTNFAPLIYKAMEICQEANDYHILVIIADGQVTNERATRRAIVQACQYPLSIIVVGVGDGPWDMMKVFDESLPKRSWDNFHFVEFHDIIKKTTNLEDGELKLAVQSLLEIPDQYRCICELGLLRNRPPPMRGSDIKKELGQKQNLA